MSDFLVYAWWKNDYWALPWKHSILRSRPVVNSCKLKAYCSDRERETERLSFHTAFHLPFPSLVIIAGSVQYLPSYITGTTNLHLGGLVRTYDRASVYEKLVNNDQFENDVMKLRHFQITWLVEIYRVNEFDGVLWPSSPTAVMWCTFSFHLNQTIVWNLWTDFHYFPSIILLWSSLL